MYTEKRKKRNRGRQTCTKGGDMGRTEGKAREYNNAQNTEERIYNGEHTR